MQIIKDMKQAKKINSSATKARFNVINLGGYQFIDNHTGLTDKISMIFEANQYGVKLYLLKPGEYPNPFGGVKNNDYCIVLDWKDINFIEYAYDEEEKERYKNKSVVGRAIVGGVLTGGIGAIVGGVSGVGQKKKNSQMSFESFFSINFNDEEGNIQEINMLSQMSSVNKTNISTYKRQKDNLAAVAPADKILSTKIVENRGLRSTTEMSTSPAAISNLDEIKKLKELLDIGAITQDEFDVKKSDLLNS